MERKALVVSFDFPPARTSAVYRMAALVRYLPENGWRPTVLTVQDNPIAVEDPSLLRKVRPDLRVVRTGFWDVASWDRKPLRPAVATRAAASAPPTPSPSLARRLLRWSAAWYRSLVYFPDDIIGWIPFAVGAAVRLHQQQEFDLIYTTSPPRAASLVGFILKLALRRPWVLEYMDPWYPPPRPIRRWAERLLQRCMLRYADMVVVMTDGHACYFREQFGVPQEKLSVVQNGYDEPDFSFLESKSLPERRDAFTFAHVGTVYEGNTGAFFPALAELLAEGPEWRNRFRIDMLGFPGQEVIQLMSRYPALQDVVHLDGFVPHRAALATMWRSDCLLLFWANQDFSELAIAGKTYESLRIGRPILAMTRRGGMQSVVERAGAGWVVDPEDRAAIKEHIRVVVEGRRPRPEPRPEFIEQFRWDRLAQKLGAAFDRAAGGRR